MMGTLGSSATQPSVRGASASGDRQPQGVSDAFDDYKQRLHLSQAIEVHIIKLWRGEAVVESQRFSSRFFQRS